MDLLHPRCAGLDVHKDSVVACVRSVVAGRVHRETRTFGTMTSSLEGLRAWLQENEVTHVVMESTGVYWKPVWHVLEGAFELLLANARNVRNVPGRKSDMNDAAWLADLLAHGLVQGSLVPAAPIQELRELTRTRKQLTHEMARHANRIHKVLQDANIKLSSVLTDVLGVSGRAMLDALISGETDPKILASLTRPNVKADRDKIVESLRGKITPHHRFLLKLHLDQYDAINASVATIDKQLEESGAPFAKMADRLETIPGISRTAALAILAEAGASIDRFESSGKLVSFAGVCPRLDESAGKTRSTRTRHAGVWLKAVIVACAWAATRAKDTYYRAQYHRIKARRGPKKAVMAVANSMLVAIFHILKRDLVYQDLGANHFDRLNPDALLKRLCTRIEQLGYTVTTAKAA